MRFILTIVLFNFFFINFAFSNDINKIEIIGNQRLSIETIKVIGNINLEDNFNEEKLNDLTKKLYESNFFSDLSVKFDENILTISLSENPIIENIEIEGVKMNSMKEFILENISLKNRKPFTNDLLKSDLEFINNVLKTNGFYFAQVKNIISKNNELNTIKLNFSVDQGSRAKIKKINFIGDKKIKDKKLLEIIASEEHKFWKFISNNVYLDQSRVNLDKRLIENYYKNLGYYNVKVLSSYAELNNYGNFNLIYNINAGDYYYFNNLILNLPSDYNPEDFIEIQSFLKKLKGEKYSIDEFNKILIDIETIASLNLYDFIDAKVEETIVNDNKLDLIFNITDSSSFYVEKINILGNYTTIEEVIRNKLIVDEGDPLNQILYNKSLDNIRSLRIFKNVNSVIKDGSNLNLKEIDITVEEMPTGEISLAAGVGTSGTSVGAGIMEKNFLGRGINLKSKLEISDDSIKGQFVYSKPNFGYTENTLSTSLRAITTDFLTDYGYKVSELGFFIGTEFEQFENLNFSPSLSLSKENLETNSNASSNLKKQEGNYLDLFFNYGLDYDLRNSKFRPSAGNRIIFDQQLPLLFDGKEITNTIILDNYKKLSDQSDMVGRASLYLKAVNSFSSDDVRISKRATVPYNRLRGFENGKIGPIDNNDFIGGNYVSTINLSTNLPFILPTIETLDFSFFVDVANVWGVDFDNTIDDSNAIRSASGIGLDLLTPIGPLNFSLAHPITKKNTDQTESFRFNLGTTF